MADRWNLEDADDGGLDNEPGDVRLNEVLRRAPKPPRVFQRPAEPTQELQLAVFDIGPYAGRSPFDQGEMRDGAKVRDGVPDKFLEKIVATADGGFAKSPPLNMDPVLYAACVSALAWRRGGREVAVNQTGPRFDPYTQQGPPQVPQQVQPQQFWTPPQPLPGAFNAPYRPEMNGTQRPVAVRMPCGHLSSDVQQGQGGRPVCGGCARLETLQAALQPLVGDKLAQAMSAVRDWEFQLRSDLNV